MSQAPTPTPAAAPAKGTKKKLLAGVAVVAILGGGGFYWKTQQAAAAAPTDPDHDEDAPAEAAHRGLVSFDPFVVNLADAGTSRFLRVSMQLVVKSPEQAAEIEHSKVAVMQARSLILELLTTQTSDVLVTAAGKAQLRQAIVEKVSSDVPGFKVIDVLFSDFVVQF